MKILKDESGQVLVMTALSMMLMLGFVGFATDVGALFHEKRIQQTATDAAAIAGAMAYKYDNQGSTPSSNLANDINNAAQTAASQNYMTVTTTNTYTANPSSAQLYIAAPPTDGPNSGSAGFVEAILTVPHNTIFMSLFGMHSIDVTTRAVAGVGNNSSACVYVLNQTQQQSMYMAGKFDVNAPNCGIVIDSTSSCALYFNGTSGSLTAGYVSVAGGACKQTGDSTPAPTTGQGQSGDPYAGMITWPTTPTDCQATDTSTKISASTARTYVPPNNAGATTICFTNTVSISGPPISNTGTACSSWLTLPSAMYVFENGVIFNGGCIQSGTGGATFDLVGSYKQGNTYYSMSASTETYFNLNASGSPQDSASGTSYNNNGFVLMQPSSNTAVLNLDQGTSVGNIDGIIYAPGGELSLTDHGAIALTNVALTITGDLVVNTFSDTASNINIYAQSNGGQSRLTTVALVE